MTSFKAGELVWCAVRANLLRPAGPKRLGLVIEQVIPDPTYFDIHGTTLWRVLVGSRDVLFDSEDMVRAND